MKLIILLFVLSLSACVTKLGDRRSECYKKEHQRLVSSKTIKDISMEMSYLPSFALPNRHADTVNDSISPFYYFRFQIKSQGSVEHSKDWTNTAYYDLDKSFSIRSGTRESLPVLVQNVIKGSANDLEYILVINKSDIDISVNEITIQYHDRLFTGTNQAFNISSQAIILLEKLS